jgi:hypothetical protein
MKRAFCWLTSTASAIAIAAAMTVGATSASAQEATPEKPPSTTWRMNRGNTPGYAMMTTEERNQHRQTMMGMKDHAACQTYMQEHHTKMMDRAKQRNQTMPAMPRQDACGWLKK